ncbi:MAG: polysaccharide biosynthesis C-terminal domain-containing protein [Ignavibacteriaceae bacterium]|nr:polysaccharide biosynthesis C-terminal domain-containing protein [Ignavibacteriaceae bacterium]
MSEKPATSLGRAAITISILGILGRGLGFIREIVIAGYFGLTREYETFLLIITLHASIGSIIYFIANNYFIPALNKEKYESESDPVLFFNRTLYNFLFISVAASLILLTFNRNILYFFMPEFGEKEIMIFNIFLISIPVSTAVSVIIAYLHTQYKFKLAYLSQMLPNIVTIISVLLFSGMIGVYSILYGLLGGYIIQFIWLFISGRENIRFVNPFRIKSRFAISASFVFLVICEIIPQIHMIVDRLFYRYVDQGAIAALNYSTLVFTLPITTVSVSLAAAIFPYLSQSYYEKDIEDFRAKFSNAVLITIVINIPVFVLFTFHSYGVIEIILGRGKFSSNDTEITARLFGLLSTSIVFYAVYSIVNKVFYSMQKNKVLFFIVLASFGLKIILNIFLVQGMKEDGLAISSAISNIFLTVAGSVYFIRKKILNFNLSVISEILYYITAGFLLYVSLELILTITHLENKFFQPLMFVSGYAMILYHSGTKAGDLIFNGILNFRRRGA